MGDIKSTLDLVMEKTKHLSLSAEEKVGQQRDVYEKRLKGLLQKYADDLQTFEEFQKQLKAIQESLGVKDLQLLIHQILKCVDPDRNNTPWLDLLETYAPSLTTPIQKILMSYLQRRETLLQEGSQKFLQRLQNDHQIQGSAVMPNLNQDRRIQQKLKLMQNEVRDKLDSLADSSKNYG